ncbi:LURP-one-related/scramblase family protein [Thalassotalea maritima]|uniref:LURP-one-related/scramblase family protein n=1 Tax=Thalassotalea maritima TaxID=3242416 RepID=UPI0035288F09
MIYQLNQKFFSLTDKYQILDADKQVAYQVDGQFFSLGKTLHLYDANDALLATIKQKLLAFRPTFYVHFSNGVTMKVMKMFTPIFKSRFMAYLGEQQITIVGDFLSHEFTLSDGEQVLAQVSKAWASLTDHYALEVEQQLAPVAICILVIIDAVHHSGQSS